MAPSRRRVGGTRVRLPLPGRDLAQEEAAPLRGAADAAGAAAALSRRRNSRQAPRRRATGARHRSKASSRRASRRSARSAWPASPPISRRMLEERCRRQGFEHMHRAQRRDAAPMRSRLLAREALTGAPPPRAAQQVIEAWRPFLEGNVGRDLLELGKPHRGPGRLRQGGAPVDPRSRPRSRRRRARTRERGRFRRRGRRSEQGDSESEGGEGATSGAQGALEGGVPDDDRTRATKAPSEIAGELMPGTGDDDPGRPGRPGMQPRSNAKA